MIADNKTIGLNGAKSKIGAHNIHMLYNGGCFNLNTTCEQRFSPLKPYLHSYIVLFAL